MENWGSFFDQAPQTEAALPVAAMRAAVRGGPKVFGDSGGIFPKMAPIGPSTLLQSPPQPRMDMAPATLPTPQKEQSNEVVETAQNLADMFDPEGAAARKAEKEGKGKGDGGFGERMNTIDQQLQAMRLEREKVLAGLKPAPAGATTGGAAAEGVFGNMIQQESGNTHYKDGKIITSPAGALGIAQIMPDTAPIAAKLAGLPWDPELFNRGPTGDPAKDAEARDYNLKLGQAYYNEQLKTFGDPALAAAAYNAGPGRVQSALEQAKATGRSWLEFVPAETQNYVRVVTRTKDQGKAEGGRVRWLRSLVGS